jgi:CRISPR-associated protein Csb2
VCGLHLDRPGLRRLDIPGLATVELESAGPLAVNGSPRQSSGSVRWSTRPERWTASARTWVTALPIVLDRYPDRLEDVPMFVAQGCVLAGYPQPAPGGVEHLAAPAVLGAPRLRGSDLRRRQGDPPRPAVHARIRFPIPVTGPVVVGHLRHVGLGLCVPARARETRP